MADKRVVFYTNEGFYEPASKKYIVARITEDEPGYDAWERYAELEQAEQRVAALNAQAGLAAEEVLAVVTSSIRLTMDRHAPAPSEVIETLAAEFSRSVDAWRETENAAMRLIAAHALHVAPDAVYMLMTASDQGSYMCPPSYLTDAIGTHLQEQEWDETVEVEDDLTAAASYLGWSGDWQRFVDDEHPWTKPGPGDYAVDLRLVVEEYPQIRGDWTRCTACGAPHKQGEDCPNYGYGETHAPVAR